MLIGKLLSFILDKNEILNLKGINQCVLKTLQECIYYIFQPNSCDHQNVFNIETVIDFLHDELNTGHWSEVPLDVRRNFTIASYAKCIIILREADEFSEEFLKKCLKSLDMGLLLGAPLLKNEDLLTKSAQLLTEEINKIVEQQSHTEKNSLKRKLEIDREDFEKLRAIEIDTLECPSIEHFNTKYFTLQLPIKLSGCMTHWPACKKWPDMNYLLKIAGNRTVPIEIGSQYVDENWSQKLMTLKEFIKNHYLSETGDSIGYLAQHNLFEQITELKEDIHVPEYCCLSQDYEHSTEPDINAWLGPKRTVSPLHQDPKNNFLAQVYGTKQVLLFSPKDTEYLYPHCDKLLSNTAQVNPLNPDLEKFKNFPNAKMYKCLLEPGEMLFIPVKWWHHVTALEKSFSVSFWWQ